MKVLCLGVQLELEPAIAYRIGKISSMDGVSSMDGALRGNRCLVESLLDALDDQAAELDEQAAELAEQAAELAALDKQDAELEEGYP